MFIGEGYGGSAKHNHVVEMIGWYEARNEWNDSVSEVKHVKA